MDISQLQQLMEMLKKAPEQEQDKILSRVEKEKPLLYLLFLLESAPNDKVKKAILADYSKKNLPLLIEFLKEVLIKSSDQCSQYLFNLVLEIFPEDSVKESLLAGTMLNNPQLFLKILSNSFQEQGYQFLPSLNRVMDFVNEQIEDVTSSPQEKWEQLCDMGSRLIDEKRMGEAVATFDRALDLARSIFTPSDIQYTSSLNLLASSYILFEEYDKAEPLALEAYEIRKKQGYTPAYLMSVRYLFELYFAMKKYDLSEKFCFEEIEVSEQIYGKKFPEYLESFNNILKLYWNTKQYLKVEEIYLETLSVILDTMGEENEAYRKVLDGLLGLYRNTNEYDKAKTVANKIIEIKKDDPKNHATSLLNLSILHWESKNWEDAKAVCIEAIEFLEKHAEKKTQIYQQARQQLKKIEEEKNIEEERNIEEKVDSQWEQFLSKKDEGEFLEPGEAKLRAVTGAKEWWNSESSSEARVHGYAMCYICPTTIPVGEGNLHHFATEETTIPALICNNCFGCHTSLPWYQKYPSKPTPLTSEMRGNFDICEIDMFPIFQSLRISQLIVLNFSIRSQCIDFYLIEKKFKNDPVLLGQFVENPEIKVEAVGKCYRIAVPKKYIADRQPDTEKGPENDLAFQAYAYKQIGEYEKAEPLYLKAIAIEEKKGKKDIYALHNLAVLYLDIGEFEKADEQFREVEKLVKNDSTHPLYVPLLCTRGFFYVCNHQFEEAEKRLLEAKEILEKEYQASPNEPTNYNKVLDFLARLYYKKAEYDQAESFWQQSLKIAKNTRQYQDYCRNLYLLAQVWIKKGQWEQARAALQEAFDVRKRSTPPFAPDFAETLEYLGFFEAQMGDYKLALQHLLEASKIHEQMILRMSRISDEKRLLEYSAHFKNTYFSLLSLFCQQYFQLTEFKSQVFEIVLRRKSLNRELAAIKRESIIISHQPHIQQKASELKDITLHISNLILQSSQNTFSPKVQDEIQKMEQKKAKLEQEIAQAVPEIELKQRMDTISIKKIAEQLPADSALVEFVCFWEKDFQKDCWASKRYIVFILIANEPIMIDLGSAEEMDSLISQHKKNISINRGFKVTQVEKIQPEKQKEIPPAQFEQQKQISPAFAQNELWQKLSPIFSELGNIKRLFVAPDGNFYLLPLEVIKQNNQRFIIEDYDISYLDSGKELLRFSYRPNIHEIASPVIIAAPDFDLTKSTQTVKIKDVPGTRDSKLEEQVDNQEIVYNFCPLPATQNEGNSINSLLSRQKNPIFSKRLAFMGKNALDSSVKALRNPYILHFATHGFFMKDEESDMQRLQRRIFGFSEQRIFQGGHFYDPMLRSGLALSGANSFFQKKESVPEAEDGLLMSMDIAGMELSGTDLVVLSACETGLGDVKIGEGVYGLRHSFIIAGARTLIVSLWKVPDEETKEIMINFYQRILQGQKKATALREAQKDMMRKLIANHQLPDPFLWGPFICVGEPGRLSYLESDYSTHVQSTSINASKTRDKISLLRDLHKRKDQLLVQGNLSEVVDILDQMLKLDPHPDRFYNRGIILAKLKRYDEARQSFEKAMSLSLDLEEKCKKWIAKLI